MPSTSRMRDSWWWLMSAGVVCNYSLVLAWEDWPAAEHLSEDAPDGPHVDGLRVSTLPRLDPTFAYILNESITSGARYHLVATSDRQQAETRLSSHSVMKPCSLGTEVCVLRASPKSQTLRSQLAFSSRLDGLRSRWMTVREHGRR